MRQNVRGNAGVVVDDLAFGKFDRRIHDFIEIGKINFPCMAHLSSDDEKMEIGH